MANFSRTGGVSLVLCWLVWPYLVLSRPVHTPQVVRSHARAPHQDWSQRSSTQRPAGQAFTREPSPADVPPESASDFAEASGGGALDNFLIALQRSYQKSWTPCGQHTLQQIVADDLSFRTIGLQPFRFQKANLPLTISVLRPKNNVQDEFKLLNA